MQDWSGCGIAVRQDEGLAPRTTWQIGGAAEFYAEPASIAEIADLLRQAQRLGSRAMVLGGGSNLLVSDGTVRGLVLRLHPGGTLGRVEVVDLEQGLIDAGGAAPLALLLNEAADLGLSGLTDMVGIPGTVGGAVFMNAGNPARGIGSLVEEIEAVDVAGRVHRLDRGQLHFAYRWSNLTDLVITRVRLRLRRSDAGEIHSDMANILRLKRLHQPLEARSAGCVFRNPRVKPAGMMIEELGLKGFRVGDAEVSEVHANYIVNRGNATCEQVRRVIDHLRREIAHAFDVDLRLEIRLWL